MTAAVGIAILARAPVPGRAKTRLIPALGAEGAARLQDWLLLRAVSLALDAGIGPVTLWWDGDLAHRALAQCGTLGEFESRRQPDGDLGARMRTAIADADSPGGTLVIGTDCPALTTTHLRDAAAQLALHDAVLYPADDGGYVLIGLHTAAAELFSDMPWGSAQVMARTRERLDGLGWHWSEPATLWDIDRPEDLPRLLAAWPEAAEVLR